jgi:formiminotetrahydrofolate cyclodeaminase
MTHFLKVEGNDSLVRDISNKAVINSNVKEYQSYIEKRNMMHIQKEELKKQSQEINNLKKDMSEIKDMLSILIGKK